MKALKIRYRWSEARDFKDKNFCTFKQSALIMESGDTCNATCYDITNKCQVENVNFTALPTETTLNFIKNWMNYFKEAKFGYDYYIIKFADHTQIMVTSFEEIEAYLANF